MTCPICESNKIAFKTGHKEFPGEVIFCGDCMHGYFSGEPNVAKPDDGWHTVRWRADKYIQKIIAEFPELKSILEIGSGCDFYFLKWMNLLHPEKPQSFLYDIIDYSKLVPDYIKFVVSFESLPLVELLYMSHSFEHIYRPDDFMKQIRCKFTRALIEIPIIVPEYYDRIRDAKKFVTAWHYHFYSIESFKTLMARHNIKVINIENDVVNVPRNLQWGSCFTLENLNAV